MITSIALTLIYHEAAADLPPRSSAFAYERGAEFYSNGNYEAALANFEDASEQLHSAELLYNLALTHYQLGNCSMARLFFRRYLKRGIETGVLAPRWRDVDVRADSMQRNEARIVKCLDPNAYTLEALDPPGLIRVPRIAWPDKDAWAFSWRHPWIGSWSSWWVADAGRVIGAYIGWLHYAHELTGLSGYDLGGGMLAPVRGLW